MARWAIRSRLLCSASRFAFGLALAGLLLIGLLLRLAIVASPLGEIDADEAVVGLMARHIALEGERPVFFYGQEYVGTLEAFAAAPLFRLLEPSSQVLKLVPIGFSLGFALLSALLARRLFGVGPALVTAAYLCIPPAMWAVWSTKARGGYAEVLFFGQALLLVTLWLGEARSRVTLAALLWGLLAGLATWTHLLAAVYVLPAVVYLIARRRTDWSLGVVLAAGIGVLLGLLPLLLHNLFNNFATVQALLQPPDLPHDPVAQFFRFFRIGVPVLVGLGQPTTSAAMFDRDWLLRPGSRPVIALIMLGLLILALAVHADSLRRLFSHAAPKRVGPALLLLVALCVPPVVALTRFGFFVSEPRYALPLYSVVPLVAASAWRLPVVARWTGIALVLALNVWSLLTTDVRLWRPEESVDSTAATRAELVRYMVGHDRHQMYTDYWIGYPVMFETGEAVLMYAISGGFNRYLEPAANVQRTPDPLWVFIPGSEAERDFLAELRANGGRARVDDVGIYRVYAEVEPLEAMRP